MNRVWNYLVSKFLGLFRMIEFRGFNGFDALTDPSRLPPSRAAICRNVEFDRGVIQDIPRVSIPGWSPDLVRDLGNDNQSTGGAVVFSPYGSKGAHTYPYNETVFIRGLFNKSTDTFFIGGSSTTGGGEQRYNAGPIERVSFPPPTHLAPPTSASGGGTIPVGTHSYAITAVRQYFKNNFEFSYEQESAPLFSEVTITAGRRAKFAIVPPVGTQLIRIYRLFNGEYRRVGEYYPLDGATQASGNAQAGATVGYFRFKRAGDVIMAADPNDSVVKLYRYKGGYTLPEGGGIATFNASPGASALYIEPVFNGVNINASFWEYVADVVPDFYDDYADSSLGSVLPSYFQIANGDVLSYEYEADLSSLHAVIRNSLYAVKGTELVVSVAGQTHAYPSQYKRQFKSTINAVWGQQGNVYVALDSGEIYAASDSDPLYANFTQLAVESRRFLTKNLVPYGGGVAYVDDKSSLVVFDGSRFNEIVRFEDRVLSLNVGGSTSREANGVYSSAIDDTIYSDMAFPALLATTEAAPVSFLGYTPSQDIRTLYQVKLDSPTDAQTPFSVRGTPHYVQKTATANVYTRWPLYNVSPVVANPVWETALWRSGRLPVSNKNLGQETKLIVFGSAKYGVVTVKVWFDYANPLTDTPELNTTIDLKSTVEADYTVKLPSLKYCRYIVLQLEWEVGNQVSIEKMVVL